MGGGSSAPRSDWTRGAAASPAPDRSGIARPVIAPLVDAAGPSDPKLQQIRLALRIVLHLSHVEPPEGGGSVRPEATQQGIASCLKVTQGAVSKVLQRLEAAEVVRHKSHHVRGGIRRMRAYSLTARGLELVRRSRDRFPDAEFAG